MAFGVQRPWLCSIGSSQSPEVDESWGGEVAKQKSRLVSMHCENVLIHSVTVGFGDGERCEKQHLVRKLTQTGWLEGWGWVDRLHVGHMVEK